MFFLKLLDGRGESFARKKWSLFIRVFIDFNDGFLMVVERELGLHLCGHFELSFMGIEVIEVLSA